jgi:hypothetical protein
MTKKKNNKGRGNPEWMKRNQLPFQSFNPSQNPFETSAEQIDFVIRNKIWLASLAWGAWEENKQKGFVWVRRFVLSNGQLIKPWSAGFVVPDELWKARPDLDKKEMLSFLEMCEPEKGYILILDYISQSKGATIMHLVLDKPRPPKAFEELKICLSNLNKTGTFAETKLPHDSWRMDFEDQVKYLQERISRGILRSQSPQPINDYIDEMPEPKEHIYQFINYHLDKVVALAQKGYKEQGRGAVCLWRITDKYGRLIPGDWGMKYLPLVDLFRLFSDLPETGVFAMIQKYQTTDEFVFCVHYVNEQLYWGVNFGLNLGHSEVSVENVSPVIYGQEVKFFPEVHEWILQLLAVSKA